MKPTMKDVARAAGVSVMTVSRAFRRDASISATTRDRIRAVADELGYVLDSVASNLRSQRSGFVAVVIPSINNANFADTVGALTTEIEAAGMEVLLGRSNYDMAEEERLIGQLLRRQPEALVVTGGRHTDRARQMLAGAGIPVVETWDEPARPIGHTVGFSNAAAAAMMVGHLAERGYRRIAFIGGDSSFDTRGADRRRGFVAAMEARGLDASRLITVGPPPVSMREGAAAMAMLLDTLPDTEAVMAVADPAAFGAMMECARRGISVPGDMAIAGFGNFEIAAVAEPSLTTIDPFPARIGAETGALIVRRLRDGAGDGLGDGLGDGVPTLIRVEPQLVVRASTGADIFPDGAITSPWLPRSA
ncbi:LacI family DNA-binding transcriptional regulator [Paracoccus sphaerophysae]|uniref:LacI family DNA-binding transcriptional regulator n=1 Tax=Paracoccus sphaerophysae TaxID=690417 RepID=UPI000A565DB5|nr:LacI family DNA-binding transcriptional regulator [Paracoccus sphaerophysae]